MTEKDEDEFKRVKDRCVSLANQRDKFRGEANRLAEKLDKAVELHGEMKQERDRVRRELQKQIERLIINVTDATRNLSEAEKELRQLKRAAFYFKVAAVVTGTAFLLAVGVAIWA